MELYHFLFLFCSSFHLTLENLLVILESKNASGSSICCHIKLIIYMIDVHYNFCYDYFIFWILLLAHFFFINWGNRTSRIVSCIIGWLISDYSFFTLTAQLHLIQTTSKALFSHLVIVHYSKHSSQTVYQCFVTVYVVFTHK